jgi:hypothetical protein
VATPEHLELGLLDGPDHATVWAECHDVEEARVEVEDVRHFLSEVGVALLAKARAPVRRHIDAPSPHPMTGSGFSP